MDKLRQTFPTTRRRKLCLVRHPTWALLSKWVRSIFLAGHPDRQFATLIKNILLNGADISCRGPHLPRSTPNSVSARVHCVVLREWISDEIRLRHLVGPFASPPFPNLVSSARGVCHNGDLVMKDLSRPTGNSVSDFIDSKRFPITLWRRRRSAVASETCTRIFNGKIRYWVRFLVDTGAVAGLVLIGFYAWKIIFLRSRAALWLPFFAVSPLLILRGICRVVADGTNHPDIFV